MDFSEEICYKNGKDNEVKTLSEEKIVINGIVPTILNINLKKPAEYLIITPVLRLNNPNSQEIHIFG